MKKRVVVTGMGVVSCFGNDVDKFYQSLLEGKSGVEPITAFNVEEYSTRFAASIHDFDVGDYMDKKMARRADPFIKYAIVAGKKALEMAGLPKDAWQTLDLTRSGVIIGSGMGGMQTFMEGVQTLLEKGPRRISPFFVPFIITNMAGALLAIECGFMGPNYSISTACATSNHSIIAAADHIRRGDADLMITGGVEAAVIPAGLGGFCGCKALSERNDDPQRASRPWDKARDGFVLGEGAGVLILESLEHAQKRGATILAEYLGGGISCDAYHMTEPHPEGRGVALCVENALRDADVKESDISYINAHATSTPVGDMAEVSALKKVFSHPENIWINSTKSMIGHCLGAAGGVEAIATIKSIIHGEIHPTINLEDKEPDMTFKVSTKKERCTIKAAISNSFGFGGHNASIVLAPFNG